MRIFTNSDFIDVKLLQSEGNSPASTVRALGWSYRVIKRAFESRSYCDYKLKSAEDHKKSTETVPKCVVCELINDAALSAYKARRRAQTIKNALLAFLIIATILLIKISIYGF